MSTPEIGVGRNERTASASTPTCSSRSGARPPRRRRPSAVGARCDRVPRVRPAARREVRDLGRDVRAGTPPHPPPARARPPRSRQRLIVARSGSGSGISRPPARAFADPHLDGRLRVEAAPLQEVVGAAVEVAARDEPDQLDARDVGAVARARGRARAGTRPARRCGRGRRGSSRPGPAWPRARRSRARARRAGRPSVRACRGRCGARR